MRVKRAYRLDQMEQAVVNKEDNDVLLVAIAFRLGQIHTHSLEAARIWRQVAKSLSATIE
jgi:hypothetical protein